MRKQKIPYKSRALKVAYVKGFAAGLATVSKLYEDHIQKEYGKIGVTHKVVEMELSDHWAAGM